MTSRLRPRLRPQLKITRITELDLAALRKAGITRLMLDLDNTLAPWGSDVLEDDIRAWVLALPQQGFSACLLSNNTRKRVRPIADSLGIPAFCWTAKPNPWGYRRALKKMGWTKSSVAAVGDQLLTDIWGGNRAGLYTILVAPLSPQELRYTRMVRKLERWLMRRW